MIQAVVRDPWSASRRTHEAIVRREQAAGRRDTDYELWTTVLSIPRPERPYHPALISGRKELGERAHRLSASAAIGFDQRTGGGAEAGSTDRVAQQLQHDAFELASRLHLHRGSVLQERRGDFGEVLLVRTLDDRFAEDLRLEDIVPAGVDEAPPDEHRGRHLIQLREFADRVEHDDVVTRF